MDTNLSLLPCSLTNFDKAAIAPGSLRCGVTRIIGVRAPEPISTRSNPIIVVGDEEVNCTPMLLLGGVLHSVRWTVEGERKIPSCLLMNSWT